MNDDAPSSLWLVVVQTVEAGRAYYSLEVAAVLTGVHPDLLRYYCQIGLLGAERADPNEEPVFDDHALYAVRKIDHLRRHQGVNLHALPLVCQLSREVERLRAELRFLRDR